MVNCCSFRYGKIVCYDAKCSSVRYGIGDSMVRYFVVLKRNETYGMVRFVKVFNFLFSTCVFFLSDWSDWIGME